MLERFDRYMDRCLYDPEHGFYATGTGAAGRREGDFITSPEVGPLFADVIARALDHWWDELDQPAHYRIYDAGTGPGTLARALTTSPGRSASARTVSGIDRGPEGETTLPDDLRGAVVIANELLDNIPFRIAERTTGGWSEVWVQADSPPSGGSPSAAEQLQPIAGELPPILSTPGVQALAPGARVPILDEARAWVADVVARQPAALLAFDYGAPTTAELGERGGWMRTYRRHQRHDDPYLEPGSWDITIDVAVDQLPPPTEVTDQATFLRRWGIDELVEEGRTHWRERASAPDLVALKMRSRLREADALLDPNGLGSWLACSWLSSSIG